ncbi:hypothetical protein [Motilimonas sp. E26]|uniref:hypothetical protein n=1 Tax=Motilimonas sp. E26 TaxID=2865674 RepID=UPI001E34EC45|nr:hypothetical protein [Motilimonas sp. E26]MCE0557461.1 hypothetical protein [Motilimonas sp. E26]
MIKIGDTRLVFINMEKTSIDYLMHLSIKRNRSEVVGRFIYLKENSPLDSLLNLSVYPALSWKSDCENLLISKKIENNQCVYKVNFCIDSDNFDEYWEINVVSAPEEQIEIDIKAIKNAFKEST